MEPALLPGVQGGPHSHAPAQVSAGDFDEQLSFQMSAVCVTASARRHCSMLVLI